MRAGYELVTHFVVHKLLEESEPQPITD